VVSPRPCKQGHHDPTKKTKEKVSEKPKAKSKPSEALPDWNQPAPTPSRHTKSDIVFWAQELEQYFFTFINYRRLNDWVSRISDLHGPGAWKSVVKHFENLRKEEGDPNKQWVFSYRNLSLLERQVNFGAKLRII